MHSIWPLLLEELVSLLICFCYRGWSHVSSQDNGPRWCVRYMACLLWLASDLEEPNTWTMEGCLFRQKHPEKTLKFKRGGMLGQCCTFHPEFRVTLSHCEFMWLTSKFLE